MPLSPDCLARLGLLRTPFAGMLSEEFIHTDPARDDLLDQASHALAEPEAIVVIAGASGAGRSVLLMRLLGWLPEHFELIAFRARPGTAFDAVDMTIRHHLERTVKVAPGSALSSLLAMRVRSGTVVVIAIDDAHLLEASALEQLFQVRRRLLDRVGSAPRFVLVGDVRLAQLALPALDSADERRVVRLRLRALDREQTAAYLYARLRVAGHPDPATVLPADAVDTLHRRANGLPKYLNALAEEWLEELCERLTPAAPRVAPLETLAPPAPPTPDFQTVLASEAAAAPAAGPQPDPPSATAPPPLAPPVMRPAPSTAFWNRRWFVPALVSAALSAVVIPLAWQRPATPRPPPPAEPSSELAHGERWPEQPPSPATPPPPASTPPPPVAAVPADSTPPPAETAASTEAAPVVTAAPVPVEPAPPVAEPAAPVAAPAEPAAGDDRAWLKAQPPEHLTIQLVATDNLAAARAYVAPFGLEDVHFLRTQARNREFAVAVVGSFPDLAAAQRVIERFPPTLRDRGYWIRTFASINQSLAAP